MKRHPRKPPAIHEHRVIIKEIVEYHLDVRAPDAREAMQAVHLAGPRILKRARKEVQSRWVDRVIVLTLS